MFSRFIAKLLTVVPYLVKLMSNKMSNKWKLEDTTCSCRIPMPSDRMFLGKYKYNIEEQVEVVTRTYSRSIKVAGKALKEIKIVEETIKTPVAMRRSINSSFELPTPFVPEPKTNTESL